jgi:hypothetical protein
MASFDREEAVCRLSDFAFENDEPARRPHRDALKEDFFGPTPRAMSIS